MQVWRERCGVQIACISMAEVGNVETMGDGSTLFPVRCHVQVTRISAAEEGDYKTMNDGSAILPLTYRV